VKGDKRKKDVSTLTDKGNGVDCILYMLSGIVVPRVIVIVVVGSIFYFQLSSEMLVKKSAKCEKNYANSEDWHHYFYIGAI